MAEILIEAVRYQIGINHDLLTFFGFNPERDGSKHTAFDSATEFRKKLISGDLSSSYFNMAVGESYIESGEFIDAYVAQVYDRNGNSLHAYGVVGIRPNTYSPRALPDSVA